MISTFTCFTPCFFSSNPACFRLKMMDAIKYFDFFKILSKISRISTSSRKRSHIPPCTSRKISDSRVPAGRGYMILPCMEKCLKRCLVSGSLIFLVVCHHLGLRPVFGLHRRYQQANVFPNAGIRFRLPQSGEKIPSLGWMFFVSFQLFPRYFRESTAEILNLLHLIFQL